MMKEKQKHKSEVMRDSGLSARHGCTGCGNSQAFYPHVCLCRRCRCSCRALLLALPVPPLFGVPREHRLQQVRPKVVRWPAYVRRTFTLTTLSLALRNWTAVMYVSCVDKRGASRLSKLLNPCLTYLSCVPQPQRHNGRVCTWWSRVVVSYVGGDDNQSPLGPRLPGSYRYYTFYYCCVSHAPLFMTVIWPAMGGSAPGRAVLLSPMLGGTATSLLWVRALPRHHVT